MARLIAFRMRGLLILSAATLSSSAMGSEATTVARPRHEVEEIARCIRVASKGNVWLERTLWGLRDQEAGWIGASVRNDNGTFDLGPLQINSWWVPRMAKLLGRPDHHVRYWLRYDPCFNASAARWIFLSGLSATGDFWKAVGMYHSPTAWRQRRYAVSVSSHLRRRFGSNIFSASSQRRESPLPSTFSAEGVRQ